ncbi:DUF5049 domain-containing protein [Lancefieldella parvula]
MSTVRRRRQTITDRIKEQILAIWDTGKTNMLDTSAV